MQEVAATALLMEESQKLTFGGSLIDSIHHQVKTNLQQKVGRWMNDSRILKYEAIFLERDVLIFNTKNYLNSEEFLLGKSLRISWDIAVWILFNNRLKSELISGKLPSWVDLCHLGMVPLQLVKEKDIMNTW
jgi:hypothetical protein